MDGQQIKLNLKQKNFRILKLANKLKSNKHITIQENSSNVNDEVQ
jgi:hypothetical protein